MSAQVYLHKCNHFRQGQLEAAIALITHGADPALHDNQGNFTMIHHYISNRQLLIGFNVLHVAAQHGHSNIIAYLVAKGMVG